MNNIISKEKQFMIKFLNNIHFLFMVYLGLGAFITPNKYLYIYIFILIITLLKLVRFFWSMYNNSSY
jgi:hypothetical protein